MIKMLYTFVAWITMFVRFIHLYFADIAYVFSATMTLIILGAKLFKIYILLHYWVFWINWCSFVPAYKYANAYKYKNTNHYFVHWTFCQIPNIRQFQYKIRNKIYTLQNPSNNLMIIKGQLKPINPLFFIFNYQFWYTFFLTSLTNTCHFNIFFSII